MKLPQILILASLVALSACYYDNEEMLYPNESSCYDADVSFEVDIKPLIITKCATAGCHVSGTGRVVLGSYSSIKNIADDGQLKDRVLTRKDMPPGAPLSACDQDKLRAWLDNGAINN
ncbi:hypothetical protein [Fulvivirga sedimenti]|uniref:Cytochrome c domain-containing protein n=1 Tax=Fulvivirga sedimenti TaxID=2879465 RepID=A0A9X1HM72_9BACT|nr:hypothetical protein [Fulvivirga sedimenti]MCA6073570.1 hypothetical protein [Fulvivirga sedimenti]